MKNELYKTSRKPGQSIAEAVEQLLKEMTLEEKFGQMYQSVGSDITAIGSTRVQESVEELLGRGEIGSMIQVGEPHEMAKKIRRFQTIAVEKSRLGIPVLFCQDVIHGFETVFPIPLAWSCSFDQDLIYRAAHTAAQEAGCCGIGCAYSPMVDIPHDPRWGRVAETAGEDPWWGSQVSQAIVNGLQENGNTPALAACLKHFLGYAAAEGGRDYNTTEFSSTALYNTFLPPFRAGVEAGAKMVMTAFNAVNGVPAVANRPLVEGILRQQLGFDGVVISDYAAVMELMEHGVAEDAPDAARKALKATLDIEMTTNYFRKYGKELLEQGRISMDMVDAAVRRVLTLKYELGLMDDPYCFLREAEIDGAVFSQAARTESLSLAERSAVLLKNDGVLPLKKGQCCAVIGPFGDSTDLCGCWSFSTRRKETVTLVQGLRRKNVKLISVQGCEVEQALPGGLDRAAEAARQADVVILALGESSIMSGEACSRMNITIPDCQQALAEAVVKVGKPTVLVLTNGRPLLLNWFDKNVNAILEGWALGTEAGEALANLLVGEAIPSGRLTMSFPVHTGQIPVYYNELPTGRPYVTGSGEHFQSKYLDGPNAPLYPFGYGLSYGKCHCLPISLSGERVSEKQSLKVSVTVWNTGNKSARETVQLYIRDRYASITRPVKELRGFQNVILEPNSKTDVTFTIGCSMLGFYSGNGKYCLEPGTFEVMVGLDSRSAEMNKATFNYILEKREVE